ncbi:DUF981 family protein [Polymorphospora sp. NPDC050346]|uniref:DUF981 family protein n=1 Tax=Polymorphospora sp. NPDC050346 TaxID=3155780 RepID=UPI0033FF79DA
MTMIMYNKLIGVFAGVALLLVPRLWALVRKQAMPLRWVGDGPVDGFGWAAGLAVPGLGLTVLGGAMTLTEPLTAKPYINAMFGQPTFYLGLLLLAASWFLARNRGDDLTEDRLRHVLRPTSWGVAGLGIILTFCTLAILRFNVVSSAPPEEPITGLLNDYPIAENTFFAVMYGLAAVGALLFPKAITSDRAWRVLYWAWTGSGIFFLLFAGMNFYTHTGMLVNILEGTSYRW